MPSCSLIPNPALHDLQEHKERLSVFRQNVEFIQSHSAAHPATHLALNEFADQTWQEFSATRLGFNGKEALKAKKER
jgi:hypothetical protein